MRPASGFFVVAAVIRVFVFELAQLQGILRALSFVGLGTVLIGIGLVSQKPVFRRVLQLLRPLEIKEFRQTVIFASCRNRG